MANKNERIHSLILRNVTEIIQFEVRNPQIGFITITDCVTNIDNSLAKIYVSFLGKGDAQERFAALNHSKGYIRSALAKRLDIYKVPELVFLIDDSYDRAQRLEEGLKKEAAELEKLKKK